jgi:predicted NAD/FAD-binding protein
LWKNKLWDNASGAKEDTTLLPDVQKFMSHVNEPPIAWRLLLPINWYLWWNGFSDEFVQRVIRPTLAILFVSSNGAMNQPTQAVLNYFKSRKESGFVDVEYKEDKVQVTPGGSEQLWRSVIEDIGSERLFVNRQVERITGGEYRWLVQFTNPGVAPRYFHDVILAVPADIASLLMGDQPWTDALMAEISYTPVYTTLHTDASLLEKFGKNAKKQDITMFFDANVEGPGVLTGYIGKIYGYKGSGLLLSVHEDQKLVDPSKVVKQWYWYHHSLALWHLLMSHRLIPLMPKRKTVHLAGDWVGGVGHHDATRAGIWAACKAGLPENPMGTTDPRSKELYKKLLNHCYGRKFT